MVTNILNYLAKREKELYWTWAKKAAVRAIFLDALFILHFDITCLSSGVLFPFEFHFVYLYIVELILVNLHILVCVHILVNLHTYLSKLTYLS